MQFLIKIAKSFRCLFLLIGISCVAPSFAAAGDVVSGPTYLSWQNQQIDTPKYSSILAVDNGFLLRMGSRIFHVNSAGQQTTSFGVDGAVPVNPDSQFALGTDGQWYVATVSGRSLLDGTPNVRIGKLGRDGSLRYSWGPAGALVLAVPESGQFGSDFSFIVDDGGIYLFSVSVDQVANTSSFFYAAWNLDGTEKVLAPGRNVVEIPVSPAQYFNGRMIVLSENDKWLVLAEGASNPLIGDVLAIRFDKMGNLDLGFADAGFFRPAIEDHYFTAVTDSYIYLLDNVRNAEGDYRTNIRRFDRNGVQDTAYGTHEVQGLPEHEDGWVLPAWRVYSTGTVLDLWYPEDEGSALYLARWRLDGDSYAASKQSGYEISGYLCESCSSADSRHSLLIRSNTAQPNQLFIYQDDGGIEEITLGALTWTDTNGLAYSSTVGIGNRLLWLSSSSSAEEILITDLEGNRDTTLGHQGKVLIGDESQSYRSLQIRSVFPYDGNLAVQTAARIGICRDGELTMPSPIAWVLPSGDWLKSRETTDLRELLLSAGGSPACADEAITLIGAGQEGAYFSFHGGVYQVSGLSLDGASGMVAEQSNTQFSAVMSLNGRHGFMKKVRTPSEHEEISSDDALQFFTNDFVVDPTFNAGSPLQISTLFSGSSCAAGVAKILADSLGRFYIAGVVKCDDQVNVYALRLLANGSLDAGYGEDGIVVVEQSWSGAYINRIDLIQQPDGKLLLALSGARESDRYKKLRIVRFHSDGDLDAGFSGDGRLSVDELDDNLGKDHIYVQLINRSSGGLNLFYMRDGGISMVVVEGDSPGLEEVSFFQSATQKEDIDKGDDGEGGASFGLFAALLLISLRVRFKRGTRELPF
ncbi:MAG: hypothetical protein P1U67_10180 [Alcanivoracaceae bacterium]|nr:hypothetical protein [Alcanivoracaceae bacterium]